MSILYRQQVATLLRRLSEPRERIQVLAGPRQVGKTTVARQALERLDVPHVYASADGPSPPDPAWIEAQWDRATLRAREHPDGAVLVLDEVQKVPAWSEVVKARWDADTHACAPVRVVLLGSSPLLVARGLTESLAGRFELIRVSHWSYAEMQAAFGWDVERFVLFGGYPGAAALADEPARWAAYVRDALVETTISRDVLLMTRVDKPALLRQLFDLATAYSGRELSYTKMLGQLHDAGNTTTLAHYLELLAGAGLVCGLKKYAGDVARRRGSSPKLQVLNTALATSRAGVSPRRLREDPAAWGRAVESAVGAHLVNTASEAGLTVSYWRERDDEVDFVVSGGDRLAAFEVKSTLTSQARGLERFRAAYRPHSAVIVGPSGVALDEFLQIPAGAWLE